MKAVEIWIDTLQHEPVDAEGLRIRRLTPAEVHQRALDRRAGWLARELGSPEHDERTAAIGAVIEADPVLAEALEPRQFDAGRYGIVLDEPVRARLRAALGA